MEFEHSTHMYFWLSTFEDAQISQWFKWHILMCHTVRNLVKYSFIWVRKPFGMCWKMCVCACVSVCICVETIFQWKCIVFSLHVIFGSHNLCKTRSYIKICKCKGRPFFRFFFSLYFFFFFSFFLSFFFFLFFSLFFLYLLCKIIGVSSNVHVIYYCIGHENVITHRVRVSSLFRWFHCKCNNFHPDIKCFWFFFLSLSFKIRELSSNTRTQMKYIV